MAEKTEKALSADKPARRRRGLPWKRESRILASSLRHSAYALQRTYYAGLLSRRCREGQVASRLERELSQHCGYDGLAAAPATLRLKIMLLVGRLLFLATFEPRADSKNGGRELRTVENAVDRGLTELGLSPAQKPVMTLSEYVATREQS